MWTKELWTPIWCNIFIQPNGSVAISQLLTHNLLEMIEHFHKATIMIILRNLQPFWWWFYMWISHWATTLSSQSFHVEMSSIYTNIFKHVDWTITNKKISKILMAYLSLCNKCHRDKKGAKQKRYRSYYNILLLSNCVWWDDSLFLMQPILFYSSPCYSKIKRDPLLSLLGLFQLEFLECTWFIMLIVRYKLFVSLILRHKR